MKNTSCDTKEHEARVARASARIKRLSREHEVIENYLQKRDVPPWFRGTSQFQIIGANYLFYALRDDMEQETTHRIRISLFQIGLTPMITNKEIRTIMKLSGGNDLAFLWFLYELHYKTPGIGFTINEQLILSSIAHLDMVPTLRELDRMLPPRQLPKKEILKQQRAQQRAKRERRMTMRPQPKPKPKYVLPYFERQPDPPDHITNLNLTPPDFTVTFPRYRAHEDPNYLAPNERNRWYADYKLQPERRIIKRIINSEIATIFEDFEKASSKANSRRTICEHHKIIEEMEKTLEAELRVIARDRCLKHLDVDKRRREECYKRVMEHLEREIQLYMCQFRRLAERSRKRSVVQVLDKDDSCRCYVHEHECKDGEEGDEGDCDEGPFLLPCDMLAGCNDDDCAENGENGAVGNGNGDTVGDKKKKQYEYKPCAGERLASQAEAKRKQDAKHLKRCIRGKLAISGDNADNTSTSSDEIKVDEQCDGKGDGKGDGMRAGNTRLSFSAVLHPQATDEELIDIANRRYSAAYDYGHTQDETPTASQMFFAAPEENQPWKFDYHKIFEFKQNTPELINIRRAFIAAVDSDIRLINERMQKLSVTHLHTAVDNNVRKIWAEGVAAKNVQIVAEEERRARLEAIQKPEYKWIDPNDKKALKQMLRSAMERLRENPRYVLASMPDSYKLPMLQEWIYERYGKVYTYKERYKSYLLSLKIFRALASVTIRLTPPSKICNKSFVSYSCRNYLLKKAKAVRKEYFDKLDAVIMDQTRTLWYAMRPYICAGGPPRNTYFAYMPARISDIMHFSLWQPDEYMDAKTAWERRMILKHQAEQE